MGKLEPVHRSRHMDVGEYQANVASLLEDRNGLIRVGCLDDIKAGGFDRLDGVHSDQRFVLDNEHDRSLASAGLHGTTFSLSNWRPGCGAAFAHDKCRVADTTAR